MHILHPFLFFVDSQALLVLVNLKPPSGDHRCYVLAQQAFVNPSGSIMGFAHDRVRHRIYSTVLDRLRLGFGGE